MREVCIAGVGMHPFGRFDDKPYWALGQQAALMALEDARMEWREIQQAFSSTLRVPLAAGTRILLPLGRTVPCSCRPPSITNRSIRYLRSVSLP